MKTSVSPLHPQVIGQHTLAVHDLVQHYIQTALPDQDVIAIYHPAIHYQKLVRLGIVRNLAETALNEVLLVVLPSLSIARDWIRWLETEKEADDPHQMDLYAEWYHQGEVAEENT